MESALDHLTEGGCGLPVAAERQLVQEEKRKRNLMTILDKNGLR
jgi:hypothetical protein